MVFWLNQTHLVQKVLIIKKFHVGPLSTKICHVLHIHLNTFWTADIPAHLEPGRLDQALPQISHLTLSLGALARLSPRYPSSPWAWATWPGSPPDIPARSRSDTRYPSSPWALAPWPGSPPDRYPSSPWAWATWPGSPPDLPPQY